MDQSEKGYLDLKIDYIHEKLNEMQKTIDLMKESIKKTDEYIAKQNSKPCALCREMKIQCTCLYCVQCARKLEKGQRIIRDGKVYCFTCQP